MNEPVGFAVIDQAARGAVHEIYTRQWQADQNASGLNVGYSPPRYTVEPVYFSSPTPQAVTFEDWARKNNMDIRRVGPHSMQWLRKAFEYQQPATPQAVMDRQLVINRAHKLILAADRYLADCPGLIPAMLKEYYEVRAALEEQGE